MTVKELINSGYCLKTKPPYNEKRYAIYDKHHTKPIAFSETGQFAPELMERDVWLAYHSDDPGNDIGGEHVAAICIK